MFDKHFFYKCLYIDYGCWASFDASRLRRDNHLPLSDTTPQRDSSLLELVTKITRCSNNDLCSPILCNGIHCKLSFAVQTRAVYNNLILIQYCLSSFLGSLFYADLFIFFGKCCLNVFVCDYFIQCPLNKTGRQLRYTQAFFQIFVTNSIKGLKFFNSLVPLLMV